MKKKWVGVVLVGWPVMTLLFLAAYFGVWEIIGCFVIVAGFISFVMGVVKLMLD